MDLIRGHMELKFRDFCFEFHISTFFRFLFSAFLRACFFFYLFVCSFSKLNRLFFHRKKSPRQVPSAHTCGLIFWRQNCYFWSSWGIDYFYEKFWFGKSVHINRLFVDFGRTIPIIQIWVHIEEFMKKEQMEQSVHFLPLSCLLRFQKLSSFRQLGSFERIG